MFLAVTDSQWTIEDDTAGTRLDKFLAGREVLGSRSRAHTALEHGKVFLNGSETDSAGAAVRLAAGDVVRVWMDRPGSAKRRPTSVRSASHLRIVHEDEAVVVLDKPAGLLVVPLDRRSEAPSVFELLEDHLRSHGRRPFVVHRIDRDTSGLVVFAKDRATQRRLRAQFKRHDPERIYLALVYGRPDPPVGTWRDVVVWDEKALIQKETHQRDPRGKAAISTYRLVEAFDTTSLVEISLRTGKRNQIRLQARLRGHTLVGEQRYVFGPEMLRPISFPRQALHAWRLAFCHPADGRSVRFEAPLPEDMQSILVELRQQISARSVGTPFVEKTHSDETSRIRKRGFFTVKGRN
jgi:23S rRNA pseudouridine1911/1915/1917 synthase